MILWSKIIIIESFWFDVKIKDRLIVVYPASEAKVANSTREISKTWQKLC